MKFAEWVEGASMAGAGFEVESILKEGYISLASWVPLQLPQADTISDTYNQLRPLGILRRLIRKEILRTRRSNLLSSNIIKMQPSTTSEQSFN